MQASRRVIWLAVFSLGVSWSSEALAQPARPRAPAQRPGAVTIPEHISVRKNVPYVSGGQERQQLDLYLQPLDGKKRPLLVWVHGGGWQHGSKENPPALPVLNHNVVLASVNYRLSDQARFPAQIQDCQAAIRWLKGNAADLGIDPEKICVWGSSAGGHLVSLLGTASESTDWEPIGEYRELSPKVTCVVDFCGPVDFQRLENIPLNGDNPVAKLMGPIEGNPGQKLRAASPVSHVSKGDAPTLIVHGDQDRLVPLRQSRLFYDALQHAGVPSELLVLPGAGHGGPQLLNDEQRKVVRDFMVEHLQLPMPPAASQ